MWKIREYFLHFSRSERNGAFLLFFLVIICMLTPKAYRMFYPKVKVETQPDDKMVSEFIAAYESATRKKIPDTLDTDYNPYNRLTRFAKTEPSEKANPEYFAFDPNTIGLEEWLKMGFSEKQAQAIEKYKASGAKFYKPEDLKKVYVIDEDKYQSIAPYVRITKVANEDSKTLETIHEADHLPIALDINTADSAQFVRLRGIGPVLASRIIHYRKNLGGFVSVKQISEVWGMPDSTFQFLKNKMQIGEEKIEKISLNTADLPTLRKHPYINYSLAKVIYNYRLQHGDYRQIDDLKKLAPMTDSIYQKIAPYLTLR